MRAKLTIISAALLAACGQSDREQPYEAANQSDPAESGMDPPGALQEAENALAENGTILQ